MSQNADFIEQDTDAGRAARPGDRPEVRPAPGPGDALWTVAEVARYLRLPVSSIYKMTARQAAIRIPHIHIGNALRFRRPDIDRWLSLLTTSNLDALAKARQKGQEAAHGVHPQATA